jgi:hypothetical protein
MAISPIQTASTARSAQLWAGATAQRRDPAVLAALGRPLDPHDPQVVRRTAGQLVSEMVYVPVLAQMREFPFGQEIGQGGRGEAVFGEQLDLRIADAVALSQRGGLVDTIARRLEPASAASAASSAESTGGVAPPASSWLTQQQAGAARPGGST